MASRFGFASVMGPPARSIFRPSFTAQYLSRSGSRCANPAFIGNGVSGKNKVSTPSQERVELVKKWAGEKGFTVTVSKIEAGYQLELSKNIAKN